MTFSVIDVNKFLGKNQISVFTKKQYAMEQSCKSGYCKKKLNEYRELTSKQYDDIDTLETDIKDKDAFVQTLVKN